MPLKNLNIRQGSDNIINTRKILAVLSVIFMFVIFILIALSWPQNVSMFDRLFSTSPITKPFDVKIFSYIYYIIPALGLTSISGLFLNAMRHRRKYDHYSTALIIGLIVALFGAVTKYIL